MGGQRETTPSTLTTARQPERHGRDSGVSDSPSAFQKARADESSSGSTARRRGVLRPAAAAGSANSRHATLTRWAPRCLRRCEGRTPRASMSTEGAGAKERSSVGTWSAAATASWTCSALPSICNAYLTSARTCLPVLYARPSHPRLPGCADQWFREHLTYKQKMRAR